MSGPDFCLVSGPRSHTPPLSSFIILLMSRSRRKSFLENVLWEYSYGELRKHSPQAPVNMETQGKPASRMANICSRRFLMHTHTHIHTSLQLRENHKQRESKIYLPKKINVISFPLGTVENIHRSHFCDHPLSWTPCMQKNLSRAQYKTHEKLWPCVHLNKRSERLDMCWVRYQSKTMPKWCWKLPKYPEVFPNMSQVSFSCTYLCSRQPFSEVCTSSTSTLWLFWVIVHLPHAWGPGFNPKDSHT